MLIQELLKGPFGVILIIIFAIAGISCVIVAIMGKFPKIQITGKGSISSIDLQTRQAVTLGLFGVILIAMAVSLALFSPETQASPTQVPTEIALIASFTPTIPPPIPTATDTPITALPATQTFTPTPSPTETLPPTATPIFGFTLPNNGIRSSNPDPAIVPEILRTTRLAWNEPERIMMLQFYREGQLIKFFDSAESGQISLEWAPPGVMEIKLWEIRGEEPEDSIYVNIAPPATCNDAKFTNPNGFRETRPDISLLPDVAKTTSFIEWSPQTCVMTIEFYQYGSVIHRIQNARSGEVDFSWMSNIGQTELKIWVPGTFVVADSMQVNVVESQ